MNRLFAHTTVTLALGLATHACAPAPEPGGATPTEERMQRHFDLALDLRQHAVAGDLGAFRATARELAELETTVDLPPEIFLQFGPLRYEAEVGAEARTNEAAAQAAAEVARTCGDCHAANDLAIGDESPTGTVGGTHMEGLSRVTRQLWAGLVGPDEESWQAGAEGLVEAGALPAGLEAQVGETDVEFVGERLRRLGREAADARRPADRVRALGEIWGTCSQCHMEAGGR